MLPIFQLFVCHPLQPQRDQNKGVESAQSYGKKKKKKDATRQTMTRRGD